jgi:hypothetical protein
METATAHRTLHRIRDLTALKAAGAEVDCRPVFQIVPVDFQHRLHPYRAFVFLCRFEGTVDAQAYSFRKCYARGCPHNLCPHVSQAVMIANRYLIRDMATLKKAGIAVEERLFTLDDMVVRFDRQAEITGPPMTLHDYVESAEAGASVSVEVDLELIPAVEHFAHHQNAQTFFSGDFRATLGERTDTFQRCFACYPTCREAEEKPLQTDVANARLTVLYEELDRAGIRCERKYFS